MLPILTIVFIGLIFLVWAKRDTKGFVFLFLILLVGAILACGGQQGDTATSPAGNAALTLDCLANSANCPPISIVDHPPTQLTNGDESPFRGYADPTIRQDPTTGFLWMAYSLPNIYLLNNTRPVPGVETHLALSQDNGQTWHYQQLLWPIQPTINPVNQEAGYINHEVPNLLPVAQASGLTWYGIRLDYFLPEQGGFRERPTDSFQLVLTQANSPGELANSQVAILASGRTAPQWQPDFNLATLAPDLANCDWWNEPALHFQDDTLYLVLRCLVFGALGVPKVEQSDLLVFATQPVGDVRQFQWRYVGKLAGGEEAKALGGEGLTQIDLALGQDGQLLAIFSPDSWSDMEKDFIHYGCWVVAVESLEPPALGRDENGALQVRAVITASDQSLLGPAACTYDPASLTGIIIGRRTKSPGFMEVILHATGIRP